MYGKIQLHRKNYFLQQVIDERRAFLHGKENTHVMDTHMHARLAMISHII
jgi:hypothetical protein